MKFGFSGEEGVAQTVKKSSEDSDTGAESETFSEGTAERLRGEVESNWSMLKGETFVSATYRLKTP